MGFLSFFKKSINKARETELLKQENVLKKNEKDLSSRKSISAAKFNTDQFQREILAFALWKYKESNGNYAAVHQCLVDMDDISLTKEQVNEFVETFKRWHNIKTADGI